MQTTATALFLVSFSLASGFAQAADVRPARVEGTQLIVTRPDGTTATGDALIGAVIVGAAEDGKAGSFRIDKIVKDPDAPGRRRLSLHVLCPGSSRRPVEAVPQSRPEGRRGLSAGGCLGRERSPPSQRQVHDHLHERRARSMRPHRLQAMGQSKARRRRGLSPGLHQTNRRHYCGDGGGHTKDGNDRHRRSLHAVDEVAPTSSLSRVDSGGRILRGEDPPGLSARPVDAASITKERPKKLSGPPGRCSLDKVDVFKNRHVLLFNDLVYVAHSDNRPPAYPA